MRVAGRDLSNSGDVQAEQSDICVVERRDYFTSKIPPIFKLCDSISSLFKGNFLEQGIFTDVKYTILISSYISRK